MSNPLISEELERHLDINDYNDPEEEVAETMERAVEEEVEEEKVKEIAFSQGAFPDENI